MSVLLSIQAPSAMHNSNWRLRDVSAYDIGQEDEALGLGTTLGLRDIAWQATDSLFSANRFCIY